MSPASNRAANLQGVREKGEVYVALLRGINVGGKNKVDMKRLKAAFEDVGTSSVQTYINSGNVSNRP